MKFLKKIALYVALIAVLCMSFALAGCFAPRGIEGATDKKVIEGDDLVAEKPIVKWEGRYEYKDRHVYLYHTATGFTVEFYGTGLLVKFNADVADGGAKSRQPYYNYAVDGEVLPNADEGRTFCLEQGEQTVVLAEGLKEGKHTVKCLKMSEPYDAVTSVISMETDGQFIYRDKDDDDGAYRFMVVCASGGSGHGALGYSEQNKWCARTTANSSSLHAFNYLTARMFDADVQFVATSGWGVGWKKNCGKSIAEILDYTGNLPADNVTAAKQTAKWDYSEWVPDVILFNIGGNDTTKSDFDLQYYQAKAVAMVKALHETYPNADMIWTHTGSKAGTYAVSALTDAGIMKEGYLKVLSSMPNVGEGVSGAGTYGANGHSSIKTHIDIADLLAEMLTEAGYGKERENIAFADYESILKKF
ncbi:MAG: hypothetical protein NC350_00085 [Corallococcus sp.]|nr:hypothetical protein [Corallococcus sp.]